MIELPAGDRKAIAEAWLARTLESYAPATSRFLADEKDRFRNPVGYALKQGLPALLDELLGGMNAARIAAVLDEIVRMRAVQDFTPSQAVGFVFLLKDVWRARSLPPGIDSRIDRMALIAFDLFMQSRERIYEIKAKEAGRRTTVRNRRASAAEGST